ncbi:gp008 [Rhodococcus phage ReqiDocB7]|uniref:gp008 n=1 Tax=Rhodococcus phage ReqiDocB7 TaxID=691966 RepID=UPI0001CDEA91|nr:gp008 [Rhodococcus phage ReqiDocB7]ADD80794.1 gp008 [Rhodococcus phage ReqiDocB7]
MFAPFIEARLDAIAGRPAAVSTELNTWITPEPSDMKAGISLYVAYTATGSLVANFGAMAQYGSGNGVSGGALYLQTRPPASPGIQMRLDSAGGSSNIGVREELGRNAGVHVHSTVVSPGITNLTCSLDAGPLVVGSVPTPGNGIPRERLILTPTPSSGTAEIVPIFAVAYNTAHDLHTRRKIEQHLMGLAKSGTFLLPTTQPTQPIFTRFGTGTVNLTPAQTPARESPVTLYGCWAGLTGSERVTINPATSGTSWLSVGRGGNGKLFGMRFTNLQTRIAYADPVLTDNTSLVASVMANKSKLSVMSLGDGPARSSAVTLTDELHPDPAISVSLSGTSPVCWIFNEEHSDAKRDMIMRAMAYRYGIPVT